MGMRVIAGRDFTPADRQGSVAVGVVNEEAATRFWHGNSPIGRELAGGRDSGAPRITIIGVVATAHHDGPNQPVKAELFVPLEQFPARGMTFVLLPAGDRASAIAAFRDALRATDPLIPMPVVNELESLAGSTLSLPRLYATLVGIFAVAALLLAVLGVYGVTAFSVAQRQREIGVRLALGAEPTRIMSMVLTEGSKLAALGVLVGFAAALALGRTFSALLFGVSRFDIPTFVGVAVLLGLMTLVAALIPARRAMRVDPIRTIRSE
jgi:putative ABC transport system permease protein